MNQKKRLKRKAEVLAAAVLLTAGLFWITPAGAKAAGGAQNVPAQEETGEAAQAEKAEEVKPAKKVPSGKQSADAVDKEETVYAAADAVRSALMDSGLSAEEIENAAASAQAAAEAGADPNGIISEKQNQIHEEAEQARIALSGIVQLEIPQIQAETEDVSGIASDMQKQLEILSGAAEGMSSAGAQFEQLQNALAELKTGVAGLTQGSESLSKGVAAYTGAVSQISEGVNALCEGSDALASGGQAMTEGYSSMLSGIGELADGLKEFDREASGELEKNAGDELKALIAKIKGLRSTDLSYNNFGGLAEGRTGSVRFIIETDEIR